MRKRVDQKDSDSHSVSQNVLYVVSTFRQVGEKFWLKLIWYYGSNLIMTVISTIFPALVVGLLAKHIGLTSMIWQLSLVGIALAVAAFVAIISHFYVESVSRMGRFKSFEHDVYAKFLATDYQNTLNNDFITLLVNAFQYGTFGDSSGVAKILNDFSGVGLSLLLIVGFTSYATSQLAIFLPIILIEVIATYFVVRISTDYHQKMLAKRSSLFNHQNYLDRVAENIQNGKDVRMFAMNKWLMTNYHQIVIENNQLLRGLAKHSFLASLTQNGIGFARNIILLGILATMVVHQQISLVEFVLYFSILTQMDGWIQRLLTQLDALKKSSQNIDYLRKFLAYPDQLVQTKRIKAPQGPLTVRFEKVTYRYPDATTDTLHEVTFKINAGQTLALVGDNGAGKSTIVRLLLGLLRPTSGEIYFNDQPLKNLQQPQIAHLVAPVFQKSVPWALTVAENVAMTIGTAVDENRVIQALTQANLIQRIQQLPQGIHTNLTKYVDKAGVELSGGEIQRLMLARALYQQTPIILLDEPMAALDALAESQLYQNYSQLIGHKTTLFISHRLASTKFCDEIILLHHGRIIEHGNHETLMQANKHYAQTYRLQSQYYQEVAD